jgi:hypothetical protein
VPVRYKVLSAHDLFVMRFSKRVTEDEVVETISHMKEMASGTGIWRSLTLFERTVDLSDLDVPALKTISQKSLEMYRELGLRRATSAAVIDGSADARMIMPLYNALCERQADIDLSFDLFVDMNVALDWLGLPADIATAVTDGFNAGETSA